MYEAIIVSRADFPITIKYDGHCLVVSPRQKVYIVHKDKIEGELPTHLKLQIIK